MVTKSNSNRKHLQSAVIVDGVFIGLVDGIVNFHNCRLISTPIAVVRCRKDSDDTSIMLPLVTLHDELMRASNKVETIYVRELFRNVLTKGVTSTSRRYTPATAAVNELVHC
jgi:hypothetical protein